MSRPTETPTTKVIAVAKNTAEQMFLSAVKHDNIFIKLQPGVKLELRQIASTLGNLHIELSEKSRLNYFGELKYSDSSINNSIILKLNGAEAEVNLNMVVVGRRRGKAAVSIRVEHMSRNTRGRIQIRRLQYEASQSRINGLLFIGPQGNGTDTYLSDKSLLIGERSQALSEPQLEIKTNNVKASHGAAVGQINPDDLFYLRSRGLNKLQAIKHLGQAFIALALYK